MKKYILCLLLCPTVVMAQVAFEAEYLDPEIVDQSLEQMNQLKAELDSVELMEDGSYALDLSSAPIMTGLSLFYKKDYILFNSPSYRVTELNERATRLRSFYDNLTQVVTGTPWDKPGAVRVYLYFSHYERFYFDLTESTITFNDGTRSITVHFANLQNLERLRGLGLPPQLAPAVRDIFYLDTPGTLEVLDELKASRQPSRVGRWLSNTFGGGRGSAGALGIGALALAYFLLTLDTAEAVSIQDETAASNVKFYQQFTEESLEGLRSDIDTVEDRLIQIKTLHTTESLIGF